MTCLDVDPYWLADSLNVEGVSNRTVETWQAVCESALLRPKHESL